nr:unnamed protein product [Spirometra erinaceieuropaei]
MSLLATNKPLVGNREHEQFILPHLNGPPNSRSELRWLPRQLRRPRASGLKSIVSTSSSAKYGFNGAHLQEILVHLGVFSCPVISTGPRSL